MFGILLATLSTFFDEVSSSIGKHEVACHKETIYGMAFLNLVWSVIFFIAIALFKKNFVFSLASLPFFSVRVVLEIALTWIALRGLCSSDRSTFTFIRVLTIPLLLIVDLILHYSFNPFQLSGIILIILTLFLAFSNQNIQKKGVFWALGSALLAVVTTSLYKYDITKFNSVVGEQMVMYLIMLTYFFIVAYRTGGIDPFYLFRKKILLTQSVSNGFAGTIVSFAYSFAPASVITAAVRSSSILWSLVSGRIYFKEKHLVIKIVCFIFLVIGIILLAL